jgi:hypothetical protein
VGSAVGGRSGRNYNDILAMDKNIGKDDKKRVWIMIPYS